ncbi:PAS domain S-box protein [Aerosakkonema funiforme]|uniref:PAS domain S-box protein n=1 Tax=Aerosakkonema funiforme TaxID=1246630 RepID=UPI0035B9E194
MILKEFFDSGYFIPHGHCYLWKPELVGLHVVSDALIAIAYYSIPIALIYFVRKRQDLPYPSIFLLFGAFIIACGTTHIMEVWTLWYPTYWLSGSIKVITAIVSLYTALQLVPLIPKALAIPSSAQLEAINRNLEDQIQERLRVEEALRQSEARYRAIVEDQTELICRFLPDNTFIFVNQAYCSYFGKTQAELIGHSFASIIFQEDLRQIENQLSTITLENPVTTIENRIVRPNGEIRYQQWINRAIFDGQIYPIEFQAVGRDITELKRTEEALRISQARLSGILDIADDAIISVDVTQRITLFNKGAEKIFGYKAIEIIDKPLDVLLPLRYREIHRQHVVGFGWSSNTARRMGDRREIFGLRKDGTEFPAEASISAMELEGEKIFTVFLRDITDRKLAEQALRESERRFRAIFDQTFQFVGLLKPDGTLLEANRSVLDFGAIELTDVVNRPFWEARWWTISKETQARLQEAIAIAAAGNFVRYEVDILGVGNTVATIDFSLKPVKNDSQEVVLLIPEGRDISDRKQAEAALQKAYDDLEIRVRERTKELAKANEELQTEIAYRVRVEAELEIRIRQQAAVAELGQQALAHNDLFSIFNQACAITAQTLEVEYCTVLEILRRGDVLQPGPGVSWQRKLLGRATVNFGLRILDFGLQSAEERSKAIESEKQSPNPKLPQADSTLLSHSEIFSDLSAEVGFGDSPLVGDREVHSGMSVVVEQSTNLPFVVLEVYAAKERIFTQDDVYFLQAIANVLSSAIVRQQAQEQIQASLKEKEVLLKEIHHRVKNNLQVISSLLGLQYRTIQDKQTIDIFQESQNRVRSMALIHENLYRSKELSKIDFAEYIRGLTINLFRSYQTNSNNVTLITEIGQNIFLDVDTAVPCGLIINEIVSNSLKYAFPKEEKGKIYIKLNPVDEHHLQMIVSDDGVGLPANFDLKNSNSLGIKLVNGLVNQLRGKLDLKIGKGTEFKITFAKAKI